MKEMVGGCCVCSDDRGWTENPLVYCDGQGCTVAVHQACYGIVTVPSGPWFCRKCESQERAAKVKCELCPSKDGALKRTDTTGWAHVICALYIPEIRFGDVGTMEPIILSMVPQDRFNKSCCICESQGREAKSKLGACMNCNKPGCKHHFHVTCAQAMGLLCEEAGTYMDNVKYCGYCPHHYSKLKKGANLKTIPAFKPSPPVGTPSDLNSEKSNSSQASGSNWNGQSSTIGNGSSSKDKSRKKPGRKSTTQVSPKTSSTRDSASSSSIADGANSVEDSRTKSSKNEVIPFANVLAGVGLVPGPRMTVLDQTSNLDKNEFNDSYKSEENRSSEPIKSAIKKNEKPNDAFRASSTSTSGSTLASPQPNFLNVPEKNRTARRKASTRSVTPTSQGGNDTESTISNVSDSCTTASEALTLSEQKKVRSTETATTSEANSSVLHSVIVSSATAHHPESIPQTEPSQSASHRAVSPLIISTSTAAGGSSHLKTEGKSNIGSVFPNAEKEPNGPAVPAKKPRRGRTPKVSAPIAPDSPPSSPDSVGVGVEQPPKRKKRASKNAPVEKHALSSEDQNQLTAAVNRAESFLAAHLNQHQPHQSVSDSPMRKDGPSSFLSLTKESLNVNNIPVEHPASSSEPSLPINMGPKDLHPHKGNSTSSGSKENSIHIRNGMIAPHMLGNQLNPNSSVAQKMTDTLAAELEAHGVGNRVSPVGPSFTGVPFPVRVVSPSLKTNVPTSSGGVAPFPQSLEQLLERQWEQGSQFLMEQAHHFDIASLLSCLHNLRQENMKLEDHVANLSRRRDRLLAVHARLSVPLSLDQSSHTTYSNANISDRSTPGTTHPSGPALIQRSSPQERERNNRGTPYLPSLENGIGLTEHLSAYMGTAFSNPHGGHRSSTSSSHPMERVIPSPVIVSSRMNPIYSSGGSIVSVPSTISPVQGSSTFLMENRNMSVLRSPSSTPEIRSDAGRGTVTPSQQAQYPYQIVSPPPSVPTHHPGIYASSIASAMSTVGTNQLGNVGRRDVPDPRHQLGRPNSIERR